MINKTYRESRRIKKERFDVRIKVGLFSLKTSVCLRGLGDGGKKVSSCTWWRAMDGQKLPGEAGHPEKADYKYPTQNCSNVQFC
ncbi:hypothetical protein JCM12298_12840 [Desulfothermus naphthae]